MSPSGRPAEAGRPDPGPVLPERGKDDTEVGWGDPPAPDDGRDVHDQWLREQCPPHWD